MTRVFVALFCSILGCSTALAQYPTRPIRYIVPFPAGGPGDAAARVIVGALAQALGQPVAVEDKPGADGIVGSLEVARAAPDGYTLLHGGANALAAVSAFRKNPPYDPVRDFTPIAELAVSTFVLVEHPAMPAKVAELLTYAKSHPGAVNFATANPPSHLVAAQLRSMGKADIASVPYKGDASAIPDLLSGRVQLLVAGVNVVRPHIREGKLRGVATLLDERSPLLPDVPAASEAGIPVSVTIWSGMFGPAKLPREVVDRLSREVNTVLKRPEVKEQLEKLGLQVHGSTPEQLSAYLKEQTGTWARLAREANIEPE